MMVNLTLRGLANLMEMEPDPESRAKGRKDAFNLAHGLPVDRIEEHIKQAKAVLEGGDFRNRANAWYWLGALEELQSLHWL